MKRKFIFVASSSNGITMSLLKDLDSDDRAVKFELKKPINHAFLKRLMAFHLSTKVNQIINLPFKSIWLNSLDSVISDPETEYHVIFMSPRCPVGKKYISDLNKKKENYRVKYYILMVDAWENAPFAEYYKENLNLDCIFTFDEGDAEKYGFRFHCIPYSILGEPCNDIKYDLYFAGSNSGGRLDLLHNVYESSLGGVYLRSIG